MNLTQLKQEAREVLQDPWKENVLDQIIDKVVDAVEESVVPTVKNVAPDDQNELYRTYVEGRNDTRTNLIEAFSKFRNS